MSATQQKTVTREPTLQYLGETSKALIDRINEVISAHGTAAARRPVLCEVGGAQAIRFSETAAEEVVRHGLKAQVLNDLAGAAHIEVRHLLEFAGIDRTTVSRRAARDDVLPQETSVKALQFTDLVATAVDVFGTIDGASSWLTKPHPALDGETPMQRARTPWGLQRVRSVLGALKYGGAV